MSIHHYNNTGKPNKGLPHISKPTRTTKTIMQIFIFQKPQTNENEQDNCHEEDKYSKSTSSSTNNKNLH
jgi:hypothetical protein